MIDPQEPNVGTELELDDLCDPATRMSAFVLIGCIVAFLVYVLWP